MTPKVIIATFMFLNLSFLKKLLFKLIVTNINSNDCKNIKNNLEKEEKDPKNEVFFTFF